MNVEVNYLAVLLAAVANMIIGFIWYSPILFAKPWMKAMGLTAESIKSAQKAMGPLYGASFVVALIQAYVLSHVMTFSMNYLHNDAITTGLMTGFWMWLGFVMPTQLTGAIFGKEKGSTMWNLFGINTGYQLVSLLVMGLIIGWMM